MADFPIVTALKDTQWIQVSTYLYNDMTAYVQTALKVAPESGATADALADEMAKNGKIVLNGVVFEKDKEDLEPESEKVLSSLVALLVRQPDWRVRVEGYTDNTLDKSVNLGLSQKRASTVATWLLEHGIDKSRVTIQGFGEAKPVADNSTPGGQAKNRRIEIVRF